MSCFLPVAGFGTREVVVAGIGASARYQAKNANPLATIKFNAIGQASIGSCDQSSRRSSTSDATTTIAPAAAH